MSGIDPVVVGVAPVPAASVCVQHTDRGTELVVAGRLDVHTVADVRRMLHEALDDPAHGSGDLLLHLSGAEVYDATGLGVVVGLHHRARRLGRRVVLLDASPRLERLLRSTRLHRVFHRPKMVSQAVDPALEPA